MCNGLRSKNEPVLGERIVHGLRMSSSGSFFPSFGLVVAAPTTREERMDAVMANSGNLILGEEVLISWIERYPCTKCYTGVWLFSS